MATFPTWINKSKKNNTTSTNASLSPRQVANKAYSLAIKKLDKDDKRRRPQYSVRERLLLSNTMNKAEDVLNKRTTRLNRRVLSFESDEDVIPSPLDHPPPVTLFVQEQITVTPATSPHTMAHIKNESPIITSSSPTPSSSFTPEQQMVVSIAVVAAAAYSSLSASQKNSFFSHDFCRPIMIPCHSMNSITI
ncbi:hypothetical protein EDC94DRAFT_615186 [Helicostylum pulchrum]|uniref:Uncharacterized protein n=1 Tax=Helicostylum pulchrum TaxID=562976 RepID=A0ABP9XP05_9FUNG|nr:hypothetical protein EDC94DRAFT_615186 [Helicostylum pulchrum]